MKTVRFASVVERAGRPQTYTPWSDPKRDSAFQRALKADRVLTVHQNNVGTKKDYATVGFDGTGHSLLLIFPKSLTAFEGKRIVGVDYDVLPAPPAAAERPKANAGPRPAHAPRSESKPRRKEAPRVRDDTAPLKSTIVAFENPVAGVPHRVAGDRPTPSKKPMAVSSKLPRLPSAEALAKVIQGALKDIKAGKVVAAYERLEGGLGRGSRS
jgi:hypothetical protein